MRKTIAKAVTWRLIGTAEIFAISFWTTGHIATAGHTAGIAAITSILMYVAHELAWGGHEPGGLIPIRGSQRPQVETGRDPAVAEMSRFDVEPGQMGRDNCPQSIHPPLAPIRLGRQVGEWVGNVAQRPALGIIVSLDQVEQSAPREPIRLFGKVAY
jgi:uncharacterized membrane protein